MTPELFDKIASFAAGAGFAGFVAVWHLWRTDQILAELRDLVKEQNTLLALAVRNGHDRLPFGTGIGGTVGK